MNRLRSRKPKAADTDLAKLRRAFSSIQRMGGVTLTGMCCAECSWAALAGSPKDVPIAHYNEQTEADAFGRRSNGMLRRRLYVNHGGDSAKVFAALEAEGLNVTWNGDENRAIEVHPRTVH